MSDRPPYYNPSYPGYPGPPSVTPGLYPHLPGEYRPPNPPYTPPYPGYPVQPVAPVLSATPIYDSKPRVIPASPVIRSGPFPSPCGSVGPHCSKPPPGMATKIMTFARPFDVPNLKERFNDLHIETRDRYIVRPNRYWFVPSSNGNVPEDAVHAGQDEDGGPIFLGRAYHDGDLLPAKICPTHGCAFVSYDREEITKMHYEVLCSRNVAWTTTTGSQIHPMAIKVGNTKDGEPLYAGRVKHMSTITPGKVHPSHGVLYIPYGGREESFHVYELLISI